ncbi:glycosyltransferase family 2 protein [Elizabethkingia anophelis]|uniref:glycosyltransferase family 2 protein n=1 Tax=Elizabethkingia anophelis TaxID=1117645 RepID=UPI0021A302C3|nr:glycosyltransferase family 2 protein [Elizabethkingia anophelis]MDV3897856.1 glycosyl transferase family 2 [Elizabethkingia anophelis]
MAISTAPCISIIVPCYNQSQYLDECLQSILDQTFKDWECIIVNDGSPDDTKRIALQWVDQDSRFKYIEKENGGLSSARNAGIKAAKGEWIQFLDSDDKLDIKKFEKSHIYFSTKDIVISGYTLFNEKREFSVNCKYFDKELNFINLIMDWDKEYSIPIHCPIFRKEKIGFFDESLKAKEDWMFWLDVFKRTNLYQFIESKLAFYRMNANSMTRNSEFMFANEEIAYQKIYGMLEEHQREVFFINRINYKNRLLVTEYKENQRLYQLHRFLKIEYIKRAIDIISFWKRS